TPGDSVVTWVPLTATIVPTPSTVSCQVCCCATPALIVAGGCGMLSKNLLVCAAKKALTPNTRPNTRMVTSNIQNMRFLVEGARVEGVRGESCLAITLLPCGSAVRRPAA